MTEENRKVKIRIHKETYREVLRYLQECLHLYKLEWKEAFQSIYADAFKQCDQPFGENWEEKVEEMKEDLGVSNSISYHHIYEEEMMELTREWKTVEMREEGDLVLFEMDFGQPQKWTLLAESLDLPMRIRMGQWDTLGQVLVNVKNQEEKSVGNRFFLDSREIDPWRKAIVPYYRDKGVTGNASFGILSDKLYSKIHLVYDFYKVLQFEFGVGGCYAYQPYVTAGDSYEAPSIIFPYTSTIHVADALTNDEYQRIYQWSNQEDDGGSGIPVKSAIYDAEDMRMYMPIEEHRAMLVEKGDVIHRKRNRYYEVIKRTQ